MSRKNRVPLADRVANAAEAVLAAQQFVSPIDILSAIGWLDPRAVNRWRGAGRMPGGRVLGRSFACLGSLAAVRSLGVDKRFVPKRTVYVDRTPGRTTLRFSRSGDSSVEAGIAAMGFGCKGRGNA
jgi:hypothetical protein